LLAAALLCVAALAGAAQVVGTVANLSGPLLAQKADGTAKILAQKSEVEQGDTLVTERNTYARIRFIDKSEITLKPNSRLKIDNFSYDAAKPEQDSAIFDLVKGGLRAVTGLLGKRNHDRFGMRTPSATIGIRGTIFIAEYVPPSGPAALGAPSASGSAPGLYVQVVQGMINVSNNGGSQNFAAGQFGYTPGIATPPVILPKDPGMHYTPPPGMPQSTGPDSQAAGGQDGIDCQVR